MSNNFLSPNDSDKVVRKLDDFPELVQALRNGDRLLARKLFAQLFEVCDGHSRQQTLNPSSN